MKSDIIISKKENINFEPTNFKNLFRNQNEKNNFISPIKIQNRKSEKVNNIDNIFQNKFDNKNNKFIELKVDQKVEKLKNANKIFDKMNSIMNLNIKKDVKIDQKLIYINDEKTEIKNNFNDINKILNDNKDFEDNLKNLSPIKNEKIKEIDIHKSKIIN